MRIEQECKRKFVFLETQIVPQHGAAAIGADTALFIVQAQYGSVTGLRFIIVPLLGKFFLGDRQSAKAKGGRGPYLQSGCFTAEPQGAHAPVTAVFLGF